MGKVPMQETVEIDHLVGGVVVVESDNPQTPARNEHPGDLPRIRADR